MIKYLSAIAIVTGLQLPIWILISQVYQTAPDQYEIREVLIQEIDKPDLALIDPQSWQTHQLPRSFCVWECQHRYKVHKFDLPQDQQTPLSLYVLRYDAAMAVYLNGNLISQTGSLVPPVPDGSYQPFFITLDRALLNPEKNQLQILVAGWSVPGYALGPLFVGPESVLRPIYEFARRVTVDWLVIYNGVFGLILILSAALFWLGGREAYLLWFCTLILCCLGRNLYLLVGDVPASIELRNFLYTLVTLGVLRTTIGFLTAVSNNTLKIQGKRELLGWIIVSLVLGGWFAWNHVSAWAFVSQALSLCALVTGGYIVYWFFKTRTERTFQENALTIGLLLASATFVLHDTGLILFSTTLEYQLSNLAGMPMVMYFCAILVSRYARQNKAIALHNELLEQRLEERQQALSLAHEKIRATEREQTIANERHRIMQDMHDGVGGRLSTLVAHLRSGQADQAMIASTLEHSLQELRFIIDSLNPLLVNNLAAALGTLRERISQWTTNLNLTTTWKIDLPDDVSIGASGIMNVYGFISEALANAARHANAQHIDIGVWIENNSQAQQIIVIKIEDDGIGLQDNSPVGYGLKNLHARAENLGGNLIEQGNGEGTCWLLQFPHHPTPDNSGYPNSNLGHKLK